MIEAAVVAKGAEVVTEAAAEGVKQSASEGTREAAAGELGKMDALRDAGELAVGGDVDSVLEALDVNAEMLQSEVRLGAGDAGALETTPLKDSKGEIQHHVSPQEAAHYREIGLRPQEVAGRECYVRDDIDWRRADGLGQTNAERAQQGLAPLDTQGRPYELHHVQQKNEGILAELTQPEHRGAGIDRVLHDPTKTSEIDRVEFDNIRADHWRARAAEVAA